MEAVQNLKKELEAEYTTVKDDLTKNLTQTKDTMGQLKQMCARLETSLQSKQDALRAAQEEMDTLLKHKKDLLDSLAAVRAENSAFMDVCSVHPIQPLFSILTFPM